jgi:hypothetical protein
MIPKEKAKKLVYKFFNGHAYMTLEQSKKCALIFADEILESHYKVFVGVNSKIYDYWILVKEEINKL